MIRNRTPLGLEPLIPVGRALRWQGREAEKRWSLL
jgi:hypothetical protein